MAVKSREVEVIVSFAHDVLNAIREFGRRQGLPVVIVLSLGCAMGISTSLFSVVNANWFAPWSVQSANDLKVVGPSISSDEWREWTEQTRSFSGLAARSGGAMRLNGQFVLSGFVSANYFRVLGIPMIFGPGFSRDDDAAGAAGNRAVISHHLWQTRFGGDANIIGRLITLDQLNPLDAKRVSLTIVGVAAPGFDGLGSIRNLFWLPLGATRHFQPDGSDRNTRPTNVEAFGRLAPGVSDTQAQAELSTLSHRFRSEHRLALTPISVRSTDRYSQSPPTPQARLMLESLLVGIVFITLIACANVSNLLLARGHARRGEIALRLGLGASRGRIIRQLLTESLVLSVVSACVGLMIAIWLPEAVVRGLVQNTPDLGELIRVAFPLDRRVFLWALATSTIACVAFGLVPALRCTDVGLSEVLKEAQGISRKALMPSLLSAQTIVSVMALAIAGLMLRSEPVADAMKIRRSVADLTAVRLDVPQGLDVARRQMLVATISEQLATMAGQQKVAGITEQIQPGVSQSLHVTPDYFAVLRIPSLSGRTFVPSDPTDRVMVVNEAFARRFWPDQNAIGQTLTSDVARAWDGKLIGRQVVGVVGNAQLSSPTAYLPAAPADVRVLLVQAPHNRIMREVASLTARLRPSVTMQALSGPVWIAPAIGPSLVTAWVTLAFGAAALLLGTIGFFSLLDYAVQQRTREIGIRRALGAEPWHVVRSLVEPAARPLLRSLLMGSAGAAAVGVVMRKADLPAGVNPLDLFTYAGVAVVLLVAALSASYAPARRAIRIEPSKALRFE